MKKGILSILIAIIGFYALFRCNQILYHLMLDIGFEQNNNVPLISDVFAFQKLFKSILISIGLLSLYLGVIATLKKNKIGIFGIILSLLLIIVTFIPFWMYLIEDHGIDLNIIKD